MDIGIVIALEEEFAELRSQVGQLETIYDASTASHYYEFERTGPIGSPPYRCVAAFSGEMGPGESARVTQRLLDRYNPSTLVMLGIAGGISTDVKLGDVVVADQVDSYLERAKVDQLEGSPEPRFYFAGKSYRCSRHLTDFVRNLRFAHPQLFERWSDCCKETLENLISAEAKCKLADVDLLPTEVSIIVGHVASGPLVIASEVFAAELRQSHDRSLLCVEMEAAGMMSAIEPCLIPKYSMIMRGVSDNADKHKQQLDRLTDGTLRRWAMHNAIQLLWLLLEAGAFSRAEEPGIVHQSQPDACSPTRFDNLPSSLPNLIGREKETAKVRSLVMANDVRILTLLGPGGVGKTSLALQVAAQLCEDFQDGICFVDLSSITDPLQVAPHIMQTLKIDGTDDRSPADHLKAVMADKQMLLVLDNFEHLTDASTLLTDLVVTCRGLRLLVTSRNYLRLSEQRQYQVPALQMPDLGCLPNLDVLAQVPAVALFVQRACRVEADFCLTDENAAAVAATCVRLDGLPLAIELAAARVDLLSPQALLSRLESRLGLLTTGGRDRPKRQQTITAAIDWSYDLLAEEEQSLFRRLSVFTGGCSLEAVQAIQDSQSDFGLGALDDLAALVEKSLLRKAQQADGEPRTMMLETIREYAAQKLRESGEADMIHQRHMQYFAGLAKRAQARLTQGKPGSLTDLHREEENVRAATDWASSSVASSSVSRLETMECLGHLVAGSKSLYNVDAFAYQMEYATFFLASKGHRAASIRFMVSAVILRDFTGVSVAPEHRRYYRGARLDLEERLQDEAFAQAWKQRLEEDGKCLVEYALDRRVFQAFHRRHLDGSLEHILHGESTVDQLVAILREDEG
jgi:predicted ATPase/nucleoside phosphorylase